MLKLALLFLATAVGFVSPASGASCREELGALAREYNLAADLPRAEPPAGAIEPLATRRSRGVPPSDLLADPGAPAAPAEDKALDDDRPPAMAPKPTPSPPDERSRAAARPSTEAPALSGAKRGKMEALIQAARAAEAHGSEAECFRLLFEARAIPDSE
jgi:hypothetical protein